jgi:hypothetical protein
MGLRSWLHHQFAPIEFTPETIRALAVLRCCGRAIVNKAGGQFETHFGAASGRWLAQFDAPRIFQTKDSAIESMRLVRGPLSEGAVSAL